MKSSARGIALEPLLEVIQDRGLLSMLGGHVLWTGLVVAALWRVRRSQEISFTMLKDPRFLRVFGLAVVLHMVWNSPLFSQHFYFKAVPLGFVAWVAILSFIRDGLRHLRLAKQEGAGQSPTT
jgi:RsiW-degrading membrane proteinase PrsW (M82 family)